MKPKSNLFRQLLARLLMGIRRLRLEESSLTMTGLGLSASEDKAEICRWNAARSL